MSLPHEHPLLLAARIGETIRLRELLAQENGKDQEKLNMIGTEAAQNEQIEVLDTLINQGWSADFTDSRQSFSLPVALRRNKAKLITWLLDQGADPNVSGIAQSMYRIRQEIKPLTLAAKYCSSITVEQLINHGARIEESEALSAAATSHMPDRVEKLAFLIDRGADVNEMQLTLPEHTPSGYRSGTGTALHAACKWGYTDSEAFLLEHGANPELKNSQNQSIEDLRKFLPSLSVRGWSISQVSAETKTRLSEERQMKREAEATKVRD